MDVAPADDRLNPLYVNNKTIKPNNAVRNAILPGDIREELF